MATTSVYCMVRKCKQNLTDLTRGHVTLCGRTGFVCEDCMSKIELVLHNLPIAIQELHAWALLATIRSENSECLANAKERVAGLRALETWLHA
jgi:hypothetical protein